MTKKIRFIGDIHANMTTYNSIIKNSPYPSIQLGDMGVGFCDSKLILENCENNKHRFIRGNHDNPHKCKNMSNYISDGTVEKIHGLTVMYVGGATSIDAATRTEGIDWWPDEELTYREFQIIIDAYIKVKPYIMVSHDFPMSVCPKMFGIKRYHIQHSITQQAFDIMLEKHRPKFWFGGHWHKNVSKQIKNCNFVCVDIANYVDFDLDNFELGI